MNTQNMSCTNILLDFILLFASPIAISLVALVHFKDRIINVTTDV